MKKILMVLIVVLFALPAVSAAKDHSKINFGEPLSGKDITAKCLKCHKKDAREFMETSHWTWQTEQTINGETVQRGKKNVINNFCISPVSNIDQCARCHAGYGWVDDTFDFSKAENIDCLVCHDNTGTYKKTAKDAAEGVDLVRVAKSVGSPLRENCGVCHFNGGGGVGVKHGDLDPSLEYPDTNIDVHMSVDGADMTCQECHGGDGHKLKGHSLGVTPAGTNPASCLDCHEGDVHTESRLNDHAKRVACQTCHIPYFAKENPTKMKWDWSTAGKDDVEDEYQHGQHTYLKKKGNFEWGKKVVPEYAWFNGVASVYTMGDKIDPTQVTKLAAPKGSVSDKASKIYPFKVHVGKQIYDSVNKYFLPLHTVGKDGYWKTFDWKRSAEIGAKAAGMEFSGEYDFAPTEMWWRINHMVSPKADALNCLDCHGDKGRLNWKALGYDKDPMKK